MDQKLSDSFEGEDKISAMIFCKMSTKKMVCNLYLNEQKWICKSDTLMKKKINFATGTFFELFNENTWTYYLIFSNFLDCNINFCKNFAAKMLWILMQNSVLY